ncbi:hypothetical protein Sant_2073 [Sodalis praecaptivus]|uniref:DUF2502 domain-containing protein n=1 Tax=Sodalis praecaptivus TaxID=1239307 RepID=W0HTF6_9GAMM|nr:DUF2502 domain-containing protein [Sodalis praecaptivus]AHF77121.1 hypothetical protein Sant_2073 [Sodalis praecaptivus]
MNGKAWVLSVALLLPVGNALAGVAVEIVTPGVVLHLGDRDRRGYYWDGYDWRPPQWWHEHRGRYWGERNRHGYYWNGWRWVTTLPPRRHHPPPPPPPHFYRPPPVHPPRVPAHPPRPPAGAPHHGGPHGQGHHAKPAPHDHGGGDRYRKPPAP